ncbi:uncharacterized protein LOC124491470 [Dermatophagoides farinae]|uniref:uncharacterized protein LOC124491470 n=1 Tax=Dermatophagoides farinae TaxID=6954 RepID=UPI003F5FEE0D
MFGQNHNQIIINIQQSFLMIILFFSLFPLHAIECVKIIQSSIPRMIDARNNTILTLDCSYSYDSGDVKLVIRWFHNDSPEPIYQWIPESNIRYVGQLIRPYFDMNFTINDDQYSKYRALRLNIISLRQEQSMIVVPLSLSGNYSCVISSIANQDSRQSQMIIYVPPSLFQFHFVESSADQFALECLVQDVYPEPRMIFIQQKNYSELSSPSSINVTTINNCQNEIVNHHHHHCLYSAWFRRPIDTILMAGTIYECRIQLYGTLYVRKKTNKNHISNKL